MNLRILVPLFLGDWGWFADISTPQKCNKYSNLVWQESGSLPFVPFYTALCGYPIVKMEIRDSSQISTTSPILLPYNLLQMHENQVEKSKD